MSESRSTAYLAPEGYESQLAEDLENITDTYGRLMVASGPPQLTAWSSNTWFDPQILEVTSINDAAKKLRSLAGRWSLYSSHLHRRASLIEEKLPKLRVKAIDFLGAVPQPPLASWTLISENKILYSLNCSSALPNGELTFNEKKTGPPSRAYLKLWELFTVFGFYPKPGEKALDLGASPGGWSWVLAELGCDVLAIDRSPLKESVAQRANVKWRQGNAFTQDPRELAREFGLQPNHRIDWVFSDVICEPKQIEKLITDWLVSGLCRNIVCTIKFKGQTDHSTVRRLSRMPGAKVCHLHHNKHELTFWRLSAP